MNETIKRKKLWTVIVVIAIAIAAVAIIVYTGLKSYDFDDIQSMTYMSSPGMSGSPEDTYYTVIVVDFNERIVSISSYNVLNDELVVETIYDNIPEDKFTMMKEALRDSRFLTLPSKIGVEPAPDKGPREISVKYFNLTHTVVEAGYAEELQPIVLAISTLQAYLRDEHESNARISYSN